MRVLGIDPGLTRCGLGVVEGSVGRPLSMVAVGVVRTPPDLDLALRLCEIERGIEAWLDLHRPDAVAVERVFSQHNVRTVMGTAQASGIALLVAARRGLPVALHTPSEVKAAVSGSGRADKAQVGAMVTRLLRLDAPPKPADAADALALAICHIWRGSAQARIDAAPWPRQEGRPGDRIRQGHRRRRHARLAWSWRSGGVGLELVCTPHTLATLRIGSPATLPTSMVVREESLTLFGFLDDDEKSRLRAAADRERRRAQAGPGDARGAHPRRAAPGGGHRGRQDADHGARASARRAPSGSSSSSRTGSARRSATVAPGRVGRARRRTPGAPRCTPAWSGSAGRPRRPTRRSTRSPPRRTPRRAAPDVAALLRAALRTLSKA